MSDTNFTLTHNVWRLLTQENESAIMWVRAVSEGNVYLHRSCTAQGDNIAVGSQDETDAGISIDTAMDITRTQSLTPIEARPDVLECVYYAVYVDPRLNTVDTAVLAVAAPIADRGVVLQDQITPFNDFFFLQAIGQTTLTAPTVVENPPTTPGTILNVASVASISIGDTLLVFSGVSGEERFYIGDVTAINTLAVTCDSPMDFAFEASDVVVSATKDMNVNGSVTPQIFEIRAGGVGSTLEIDLTRLIMQCLTSGAVDMSKFGDIVAGLTNGLLLRENNGVILNKWNVKTNGELAALAYDWNPLLATNPAIGQDGFLWRYTLSGQDKHGVAFRVGPTRTLQMIVQDNLSTITTLRTLAANHEVIP